MIDVIQINHFIISLQKAVNKRPLFIILRTNLAKNHQHFYGLLHIMYQLQTNAFSILLHITKDSSDVPQTCCSNSCSFFSSILNSESQYWHLMYGISLLRLQKMQSESMWLVFNCYKYIFYSIQLQPNLFYQHRSIGFSILFHTFHVPVSYHQGDVVGQLLLQTIPLHDYCCENKGMLADELNQEINLRTSLPNFQIHLNFIYN